MARIVSRAYIETLEVGFYRQFGKLQNLAQTFLWPIRPVDGIRKENCERLSSHSPDGARQNLSLHWFSSSLCRFAAECCALCIIFPKKIKDTVTFALPSRYAR